MILRRGCERLREFLLKIIWLNRNVPGTRIHLHSSLPPGVESCEESWKSGQPHVALKENKWQGRILNEHWKHTRANLALQAADLGAFGHSVKTTGWTDSGCLLSRFLTMENWSCDQQVLFRRKATKTFEGLEGSMNRKINDLTEGHTNFPALTSGKRDTVLALSSLAAQVISETISYRSHGAHRTKTNPWFRESKALMLKPQGFCFFNNSSNFYSALKFSEVSHTWFYIIS